MENYALSIANYFVLLSQRDDVILRQLKLMKLVYIAHGYMLALLDRPTEGAKLEKVEAWRYGPVFPSVYNSFKDYGSNPIVLMAVVDDPSNVENGRYRKTIPMIEDESEKVVCEFVWQKYAIYTDSTLISALHAEGTPWSEVYRAGENAIISDEITKRYYKQIIDDTLKS